MTEEEIDGLKPGDVVEWLLNLTSGDKIHCAMLYTGRESTSISGYNLQYYKFVILIDDSTGYLADEVGTDQALSNDDLRQACTLLEEDAR